MKRKLLSLILSLCLVAGLVSSGTVTYSNAETPPYSNEQVFAALTDQLNNFCTLFGVKAEYPIEDMATRVLWFCDSTTVSYPVQEDPYSYGPVTLTQVDADVFDSTLQSLFEINGEIPRPEFDNTNHETANQFAYHVDNNTYTMPQGGWGGVEPLAVRAYKWDNGYKVYFQRQTYTCASIELLKEFYPNITDDDIRQNEHGYYAWQDECYQTYVGYDGTYVQLLNYEPTGPFDAIPDEPGLITEETLSGEGGICGDSMFWSYDEESKTLTISGEGEMYDWIAWDGNAPWYELADAIEHIVVDNGVTSIGVTAFADCRNAVDVSLPASVDQIGSGAFRSCSALTSVELPQDLITLGAGAFYDCSNLETISIPAGITSIQESTFEGCTNLREVTLTNQITSVEDYAFYQCETLTTINFTGTQEEWQAIQMSEFGNDALTSANINCNYVPEVPTSGSCGDDLTWSYDETIKTITISGTGDMWDYQTPEIGDANIGPWKDLDFTALVVEEGVTSIGWDAFKNLPNLTSVTLPNTLRTMRSSFPFTGLTSVTIPEGVTSIDFSFWGCSNLSSVTIPNTVTSMQLSFIECYALTSIDIPDGVTDITGTFQGCTGLTEVTIPSSVTSMIYTFGGCTNLASVTIPASVTFIGEYTFVDCDKLTTVNYTGTQAQWDDIELVDVGNEVLKSVTVNCAEEPDTETPEPTPEPEQPTPPATGGETTTQNKVDVTVSGDKAETTVGGVDIVLGNAGKAFEAGTVVTVEKITQGTIYDTVEKALEKVVDKMDNTAIFEFTATLDGKTVQPDGTLSVTFDIPKGLTASNLKMFYVSEDGKYEEVKITVDTKANTVTANLEHFSTYVLANVAPADNDSGVPDTGDTSALTLYVCVLAMAMAGLTILLVHKRKA